MSRRGRRACAGKCLGSCSLVLVSTAGDFSAVSRRRRVGWRGTEPVRASILSVYASKSSLPGDCHVAALLAMTVALRVFAWVVIRVRLFSFLLWGISRLMPLNDKSVRNLLSLPPRGKVDCRSIAKARRMRGKRRYVFIRFYSPHSPLGSLTLALVPPSPKGEGISGQLFKTSFRPE